MINYSKYVSRGRALILLAALAASAGAHAAPSIVTKDDAQLCYDMAEFFRMFMRFRQEDPDYDRDVRIAKENGVPLRVVETAYKTPRADTPAERVAVVAELAREGFIGCIEGAAKEPI